MGQFAELLQARRAAQDVRASLDRILTGVTTFVTNGGVEQAQQFIKDVLAMISIDGARRSLIDPIW